MITRILFFLIFSIIHNSLFIIPTYAESPISSGCGTSHENAICNLNVLEPKELTTNIKIEQPNVLDQLRNALSELLRNLGFPVSQPQNFYPRSELQNQSELPPELKPTGPPEEQL